MPRRNLDQREQQRIEGAGGGSAGSDFFADLGARMVAQEEAEREASAAAEVQEQKDALRCRLILLPNVPSQPFRAELTIEQNNIFTADATRMFIVRERQIDHPVTGEKVIRRVTVGKAGDKDRGRGVLTPAHQFVFHSLLKLWGQGEQAHRLAEEEGKHYASLTMSAYAMVTSIWGSDKSEHYQQLKTLLFDLSAVPITLENVYTAQGLTDRVHFKLLADVQWREQERDKKTGTPLRSSAPSEVHVLFSAFVTDGFLKKHVKVMLWEPYKAFQGRGPRASIASLLYGFLDGQLAASLRTPGRKPEYQARLSALADEFDLPRHKYKSQRLHQFAAAVRVLDGQKIRAGGEDGWNYRLHVSIEPMKDASDYKLVARLGEKLMPEQPSGQGKAEQLDLL